jgi:hypothetical protein
MLKRLIAHLLVLLFLLTTAVSTSANAASFGCNEPTEHAVTSDEIAAESSSKQETGAHHQHAEDHHVDFSALCHAGMADYSGCLFPVQGLKKPQFRSSVRFHFAQYGGQSFQRTDNFRPPRVTL